MKILTDPRYASKPMKGLPASLKTALAPWARAEFVSLPFGNLLIQQFDAREFAITVLHMDAISTVPLSLVNEESSVALVFAIGQSCPIDLTAFGSKILEKGKIVIVPFPSGTHRAIFNQGMSAFFLIELRNSLTDALEFAAGGSENKEKEPGGSRKLSFLNKIVSADWRFWSAVNNIQTCQETAGLLQLFLHKAILELLTLYLLAIRAEIDSSFSGTIPNQDLYEKIRQEILASPHIHRQSINNLCRQFGLSAGVMVRNFKLIFGMIPTRFVRSQALEKAWSLLNTTRLSIEEIALETGYTEVNNFYPAFKKKFGISPGELRKQGKIP